MAYTNAIFYMNLVSGSDAVRTTFAPTNYSNNGAGLVRVNRTAHGLVTGAVIDITGSGVTAYNQAWKITRIDADNFDLDTSTYTSNPATKGTVNPRGGSSWSDAWLTPTSGATAARVAAGDTIRIAKTDDPVSVGNATWTSLSPTVTLASAVTKNVDNCETAWTAANSATVSRSASGGVKQGSFYMQITTPSTGTTTNTKYAYYTLPATLDLSAYQELTCWNISTSLSSTTAWQIRLCSDTTGDTAVDSFVIPVLGTGSWVPRTIAKTGGGNLGNSIKSIALYSGASSPGNSVIIRLDNISATQTNNMNLNTLIGQSSNGFSLTQPWHSIQSITDTNVRLDCYQGTPTSSKGWYTEGITPTTVTTYIMKPFYTTIQTSSSTGIYTLNTTGTASAFVTWSGGWNTTNTTQDGVTWFDNQYELGGILFNTSTVKDYNSFYRIGLSRASNFFSSATSFVPYQDVLLTNVNRINTSASTTYWGESTGYINGSNLGGIFCSYAHDFLAYNNVSSGFSFGGKSELFPSVLSNLVSANHAAEALTLSTDATVDNAILRYSTNGITANNYLFSTKLTNVTVTNNNYGLFGGGGVVTINNLISNNNTTAGLRISNPGTVMLNNPTITDTTSISYNNNYNSLAITNYNGSATDNRYYTSYSYAFTQSTTRHTASGVAWQVNITNIFVKETNPYAMPIAKIACSGNKLVTFKVWVKLSNSTDIGAKIRLRGGQLPGILTDVIATKSSDTNWEELTLTFTPTIAGVIEIELLGFWKSGAATQSIYVDDVTVTEA